VVVTGPVGSGGVAVFLHAKTKKQTPIRVYNFAVIGFKLDILNYKKTGSTKPVFFVS
jgi:hypothetical protein